MLKNAFKRQSIRYGYKKICFFQKLSVGGRTGSVSGLSPLMPCLGYATSCIPILNIKISLIIQCLNILIIKTKQKIQEKYAPRRKIFSSRCRFYLHKKSYEFWIKCTFIFKYQNQSTIIIIHIFNRSIDFSFLNSYSNMMITVSISNN